MFVSKFIKQTFKFPFRIFINCVHSIQFFLLAFKYFFFNDCITHFPFYIVRVFYLRHFLNINVGKNSFIHLGARFEGTISIGDNTVIGRNCILKGEIEIKNNVSITAETYIFTSSHIVNDPDFNCFYRPVLIDDYAWIGARAMILPGVQIGRGAVLGATSTATKSIPDYEIHVGVPARKIGLRSKDLTYQLNYRPFFQ